ncbi:MAG: response regulator [Dehalococcoidia bacterium]
MLKKPEPKLILIIDDEDDIRIFASRLLEMEGYRVLQAGDGEEGLRMAGENLIDGVLLDIRMPGIDGWEVLQQLKEDSKLSATPVIVFTAYAEKMEQERALSMGASAYLIKPLSADQLMDSVARIFR